MNSTIAAVVGAAYGLAMIAGGVAGYRLAQSRASLIGGSVIGGLALIGSGMMLAGSDAGRGIALIASIGASLFFGWTLSRGVLTKAPVTRAARLLVLSLVVAAILVYSGPATP
jgi:uncharacterized membrane protein (UPF0136 family)